MCAVSLMLVAGSPAWLLYMCGHGLQKIDRDSSKDPGPGEGTYLSPWGVRNLNKYLAQACQKRRADQELAGPGSCRPRRYQAHGDELLCLK